MIRFSRSAGLRRAVRLSVAAAGAVACAGNVAAQAGATLADLPIEQLLEMEVTTASRFAQKLSEAPSNVSVVTAADIKAFGWRTLADILGSMRGLHTSYDRNYSYLGARGFLRPGDYNTRFLLLVDGNRNNDGVYDQASIGSDFGIDVDLIERVEFVPGPGSSVYGANAFFGVINVITKNGGSMAGPSVALEGGSFGRRKARASYGMRGSGGNELLLSVTGFRERGRDLYYPQFASPDSDGVARGLDHDRGHQVLLKGSTGPFSMSLAHAERGKGVPTASYEQTFNDPRSRTVDVHSAFDVGYRDRLSADADLTARVYWGRHDYQGDYAYTPAPLGVNRDRSRSRWWGAESKLVSAAFDGHKVVVGAEYQRDYRRDQANVDTAPYAVRLDDHRQGYRAGLYAQDEITLRDNLLLNAGVRMDRNDTTGNETSPRVALIHRPAQATTMKLIHGRAFRAPNAYESYYNVAGDGGQKANPALEAERIRSTEASIEQYLNTNSRVLLSVFRNEVSGLITQVVDPVDGMLVYANLERADARGIELELEQVWTGGGKLRASYSWQDTRDRATGRTPPNSPRHLAKLNLSAPIPGRPWLGGLELRYTGRRNTLAGSTGGYLLTNLTLSAVRLAPGLSLSASLYNLFDTRYADPGGEEHLQDVLRQDGRSLGIRMEYEF
ncbi:MAG TPA: TonB-dependent receptor [Noviherbaspirillum sp.]|uniref:TonB-dependent receptor plug domain-containing protein n=1 Tax=Noviherbaspirillum sp. TaxID=1926288 RepID=UPI002F9325B4